MRRRTRQYLLLGMAALLVASCTTASTEPPAGALKADAAFPTVVGTKWVTRTTDHQTGSKTERTWTVVDVSYEGRSVHGMTDGTDVIVLDKATRNWIATLRDGKERFVADPHDGTFSWPLWVGKSWMATHTYYDRVLGRRWNPIRAWWQVAAYEDVTVPAGTFKAFRLESSPDTNNATRTTLWYGSEVTVVVKRIFERTADHYLGYGRFTTELVRFERQ